MVGLLRGSGRSWKLLTLVGLAVCLLAGSTALCVGAAKQKPATVLQIKALEQSDKDKYWQASWTEVYKTVPELILQHQDEMARNLRRDKLMHGDTSSRQIAITFDDGPHPQYTPQLLAVLKRYNVKATFFLVGMMAEKYPDLVKAELAAGHCIANHTYHHVNLTKIPQGYVATEIDACGDVIKAITGKRPHLFRPPGGDYNDHVAEVAAALHYTIVLWTDDPGDYASPGDIRLVRRLLDGADNGGIILIHDGIQQTVNMLPKVIQKLRDRGYKFVTIDDMIKANTMRK